MASGQTNYQLVVYRPSGYRLTAHGSSYTAATTTTSAKLEFFLTYDPDLRETAMSDFWDTGVPRTNNLRIEIEFTINGVVRKPRDKYTMVGGGGGGSQGARSKTSKFRGSIRGHKKNVFLNSGRPGARQ